LTAQSGDSTATCCYEAQVREWCRKHDFTLHITNQGHHWQLTKEKFAAEWWPSSAKLVFNK